MSAHPLSVTEVSSIIKQSVETNSLLSNVAVCGEVSNVTKHSSGHIYFTLKDKGAVISAAFFKYANSSSRINLKVGMSIIAVGNVTVYEKRGNYQLIVKSVADHGIGALQKQIEELKAQLSREGLFDSALKRPLPYLPKRVGVVTSPTGAAFRDILKVMLNRYPNVEVLLAPAKVQGDDAAITIVRAIEELNKPKYEIDLIIAGRGGGSFEDLMPFNEEPTVRAFAESRIPIISAVGHQIDHPLTDDVADACAATPSAAAEMAVPVKAELEESVLHLDRSLVVYLEKLVEQYRRRIEAVKSQRVFHDPLDMINLRQITVEELRMRVTHALSDVVYRKRVQLQQVKDLSSVMERKIDERRHKFMLSLQALDQLSPLKVMARGYSVAKSGDGVIIKSVDQVEQEERVDLFFCDGSAQCEVKKVSKGVVIGKEK